MHKRSLLAGTGIGTGSSNSSHSVASSLQRHLQQEAEEDLTYVPLGARGFSSRSLGSLRMLLPQGVQARALESENITHPSLKVPPVEMSLHLTMLSGARADT